MRNMYALKYKSMKSIYKDTIALCLKNANELVSVKNLSPDEIISKFIDSNYDIKMNNRGYVSKDKDFVMFYLINPSYKSLICRIGRDGVAEYTEIGKNQFTDTDTQEVIKMEVMYAIRVTVILDTLYGLNKLKEIKGKYKNKLKLKGIDLECSLYPENEQDYLIEKSVGKVSVLVNNFSKVLKTIPSKEYPLPNNNEISIFMSSNTEDIKSDKISDCLSKYEFEPGRCYSNSEKIMKILKDNNVENKIEFYGGWLLTLGQMIHHGWIVVDDNHVIDVGLFRDGDDTTDLIKDEEIGIPHPIDKKRNAEIIVRNIKSKKPFKEKYQYGKVLKEAVYIGVKSNREESLNSYRELMDKIPNHPDYVNLKPDGSNETLDMIMKMMHK